MSQWATTVARRRRRGHFSSSLGLVNRHAPVEQPALPVECQLDEPGWIAPVPDDMVDEARRVVPEDAVHPAAQRYVALVGPVRSGSRLPPVIDMTLFAGLRVGRAVHLDDPGVLHRRTGAPHPVRATDLRGQRAGNAAMAIGAPGMPEDRHHLEKGLDRVELLRGGQGARPSGLHDRAASRRCRNRRGPGVPPDHYHQTRQRGQDRRDGARCGPSTKGFQIFTSSTRRLFCRPSAVVFNPAGLELPRPLACTRPASTP